MRQTNLARVVVLVIASAAPLACKDRSAPVRQAATTDASLSSRTDVPPREDAATTASADAGADAAPDEAIPWNEYFSLQQRPDDVRNAYQETYEKMTSAPLASFDDAVVLCRMAIVEPAPLPSSAWDRANGRDLLLEVEVDDARTRTEGPLGHPAFHVRVDDALRRAASGARVSWVIRDRDQQRAYPYETGIEIGTFVVPRDVKVPFHVKPPKLDLECRGAASAEAARALLADADRALADAERKASSAPIEPRDVGQIRSELSHAADRIRVGEVIALTMKRMEEWSQREERLRAIVRRYVASAREAFEKIAPVPPGTWARIGPTLSARVGAWVCPGVPKGADPGPLNDDQREDCGLVLELRSAAKLRFDPNAWGPAYACRITGPIAVEVIEGPGKVDGVCTLGVRRGSQWLKTSVELGPTEPTVFVLRPHGTSRVLRVNFGGASALFEAPPRPPAP